MILTKAFGNLRKQLLRHVGTKVGLSKSRVSDDTARARPFPTIKIFLLLGKKKKEKKNVRKFTGPNRCRVTNLHTSQSTTKRPVKT